MITAINPSACSPEFLAAFKALGEGRAVRRASWPAKVSIQRSPNLDCLVVVRPGSQILPVWQGPSAAESDADDWQIAPEV